MLAELPKNEISRIAALHRYDILDTMAEQAYDDITAIAAYIAQTPIALISLVDSDRQWFKSKRGLDVSETSRDFAFCAHAILKPEECMTVPNAEEDPRFADNPLVTGDPNIRFYFGAPLITPDKQALGTLCVIDRVQRSLSPEQTQTLAALSRQVIAQLELRRHAIELRQAAAAQQAYTAQLERYQQALEQTNSQLKSEGLVDKLTGVGNRAAFDQRLEEEIYRAARYGAPLSLLLIDVDKFKQINDTLGHLVGDEAVQLVAQALGRIRPSDFLARYGGDEFAVILPATEPDVACLLGERLRSAVNAAPFAHGQLTVSIGAATLAAGQSDAVSLIEAADNALYAAKKAGRNRVVHVESLGE